jgi:hypothetical protein
MQMIFKTLYIKKHVFLYATTSSLGQLDGKKKSYENFKVLEL